MPKSLFIFCRILILIVFTAVQIKPVFAIETKNSAIKANEKLNKTNADDEPSNSFDKKVELMRANYNHADTLAELVLLNKFDAAVENFLLKMLLKEGSYDTKPLQMKLINKENSALFKLGKNTSIQINKDDKSIWINSERLKTERVKDIYTLHDEVLKILSKKNKYSLLDLFMPRAEAAIVLGVFAVVVLVAGIGVLALEVNNERNENATEKRNWAIQSMKIEKLKCEDLTVKKSQEKLSLPKEVEVGVYDYNEATGFKDLRVGSYKFKITYNDDGQPEMISDSKGCEHVLELPELPELQKKMMPMSDAYRLSNMSSCKVPINLLLDKPYGAAGQVDSIIYYQRLHRFDSPIQIANHMFGYQYLNAQCSHDQGKTLNTAATDYLNAMADLKDRAERNKARLKREADAEVALKNNRTMELRIKYPEQGADQ
ncbi:MAG: hypothetical protein AABY53_07695 [Bdellovibrionota bacterium]